MSDFGEDYKYVFWNDETQRIRWTRNCTFQGFRNYHFVGSMTKIEFDLFLEILVSRFGDNDISLEEFEMIFGDLRTFCDRLKGYINDALKD
jgi:hypothetical protein